MDGWLLISIVQVLTAERAFLCLSLFNVVQLYMTRAFPCAISLGAEIMVSIKRIQDFLSLEEREEPLSVVKEEEEDDDVKVRMRGRREGVCQRKEGNVSLHQVTARWEGTEEDTLSDITMEVVSLPADSLDCNASLRVTTTVEGETHPTGGNHWTSGIRKVLCASGGVERKTQICRQS